MTAGGEMTVALLDGRTRRFPACFVLGGFNRIVIFAVEAIVAALIGENNRTACSFAVQPATRGLSSALHD